MAKKEMDRIEARLAKLQKDAAELHARQKAVMVQRAQDIVATFELTAEDLFGKTLVSARRKVGQAPKGHSASRARR